MKFVAPLCLLLAGWSPFLQAVQECRNGACSDISGLDTITIIPTENMLTSATAPLVVVEDYCAYVYSSNNNTPRDYDVMFRTVSSTTPLGNGNFRIGGNSGPQFNLKWRGNPDRTYTNVVTGQLTRPTEGALNCTQRNSQASLQLTITSAEIQAAQPGDYSGSLSMDLGRGNNAYHSAVNFEIRLPKLAKISRLDDVVVETRNNNNNAYVEDEGFCVFVWGGGNYTVSAEGSNDSGTRFRLMNSSNAINYSVRLRQTGRNWRTVRPNQSITLGGGHPQLNCNNTDNADIRIRVRDSDINNSPSGVYRDTLTLTVAPT